MRLFLSIGFFLIAFAQNSDQELVKQTIMNMFKGMHTSDSSLVASTFHTDIKSQSVFTNRDGKPVVTPLSNMKRFIVSVGTKKEAGKEWDERIYSWDIKIDGNLATVWTDYGFYIGDQFSHCGVNSFQLFKSEAGWKIIYIVDTRRRSDCETH